MRRHNLEWIAYCSIQLEDLYKSIHVNICYLQSGIAYIFITSNVFGVLQTLNANVYRLK